MCAPQLKFRHRKHGTGPLQGRRNGHYILCRRLVHEGLESLVSELRLFRVRVFIEIDEKSIHSLKQSILQRHN